MAKKEKIIENMEILRTPTYFKIYVTNIKGGLTDQDFRFELLNEKIQIGNTDTWKYVSDGLLILSPIGAKRLFEELKKSLEIYENESGVIELSIEGKEKNAKD